MFIAGVTLVFAMILQMALNPPDPYAGICAVDFLTIEEQMLPKDTCAEPEFTLQEWEIDILAKCVEAEAGDQPYLGKCYVVDVILNRMEQWNKTCEEVIFQKNQFEVVSNGRIYEMKPSQDTYDAIAEECQKRKNTEILYFCMYRWFDSWAHYEFTYPEDRPKNCHHFYK